MTHHHPHRWFWPLFAAFSLTFACGSNAPPKDQPSALPVPKESPAQVLFILTSATEQVLANGKRRPTGYFLSEFYEPYAALKRLGHNLSIATPEGKAPAIDPEGLKDDYWQEASLREKAIAFTKGDPAIKTPLSLEQVVKRADEWDALVIPGGQGVMVDLYQDEKLRELLVRLGEAQKPVGLICHAPALLAELPSGHPFVGRKVTAVSPFEEFYIETFVMGGKAPRRRIGRSLRKAGFDYNSALPKANHAVRDGNLVTSQNPFSGDAFLEEFLGALHDSEQSRARSAP